MGGLRRLFWLCPSPKQTSCPSMSVSQTEWGFAVDKIRKRILSFQDGASPELWFPEDGTAAAELGHLGLMKALQVAFRYSVDAMDSVARAGHVDVLEFLWRQNYSCTTEAMDGAAKEGHIWVVLWLHENTTAGATKSAMDQAASNGHLSMVKWLHHNRKEGCTLSAMNWAASKGHLDVVEWLHHNRQEGCSTAAFDRAAMNNHIDVVMWLINNRGEGGTEKALQWAAGRGHVQMVKLLSIPRGESEANTHDKRDNTTFSSELDITSSMTPRVKMASRGFPRRRLSFLCSKFAMDKAAQGGHMGVLQLLHHQGHSCSTNAMDWAAAFGQLEVVKWLSENRSEGCTKNAMDHAAANGHLETVKWLHDNRPEGCTRYAMTDAAGNGHMDTVQWLHRHRDEGCGRRAMDDAAENGHLGIVRWLYYNRGEGCSVDAMERAARNGHLMVVTFLHMIRAPCSDAAIQFAYLHKHIDVYNFLGKAYPDKKRWMEFNKAEATVLADKNRMEDDKRRDLAFQKQARRRWNSLIFSETLDRNRRQLSLPIMFGQDGKPALRPIKTFHI